MKKFGYNILALFIILTGYCSAQEPSLPVDSLDFSADSILPDEILPEMAQLSERINEIKKIINDKNDILDADLIVKSYDSILKVEKNDILQNLNLMTYRRMEIRIRAWKNYRDKFDALKERMKKRTSEIESINYELSLEHERWNTIDKLIREEPVHPEIQLSIDNILNELNRTKNEVIELSKKLYVIQQRQQQLIILIDDMIKLMEEEQRIGSLNYFVLDSRPIWFGIDSEYQRQSLGSYFTEEFNENVNILTVYLRSNRNIVVLQLIFIILLISGFVFLGRIWPTQKLDPGSLREVQAGLIIRRPFFSSLLISLIFSLFFYTNRPLVLVEFFMLLMFISTVVLLPALLSKKLKIPLYILLVLFVFNLFRDFLPLQSFANRIFLFVQGFAIIYLLLAADKLGSYFKLSTRGKRIYKKLIKTFGILIIIALISNIIGSVKLANFLISSTTRTLTFTAVIVTVVILLNSMLILLIKGKHAQSIPLFEQLKKLIDTRIRPLIIWSAFILWSVATLTYFMLFKPFKDLINTIMGVKLPISSISISIGNIFSFALIVFLTFILVRFTKNIFKDEWVNKSNLPRGTANAISMVFRYVIVVFGVYLALNSLGLNMNKLGFIAGALGVGIGFGLQNIVLNLIAGLILAVEQPIHIGDVVEVDQYMGKVIEIGVRASKVLTWDGSEVIIPNGSLISNKVVNWTLTDQKRRLVIPIRTAFDADLKKVMDILKEVATNHPNTLDKPIPMAVFNGYGSSSLDFTLYCWVDFNVSLSTKSDIAISAHNALADAGIPVPLPVQKMQIDRRNDNHPLED